jgi:hypothetical protein
MAISFAHVHLDHTHTSPCSSPLIIVLGSDSQTLSLHKIFPYTGVRRKAPALRTFSPNPLCGCLYFTCLRVHLLRVQVYKCTVAKAIELQVAYHTARKNSVFIRENLKSHLNFIFYFIFGNSFLVL